MYKTYTEAEVKRMADISAKIIFELMMKAEKLEQTVEELREELNARNHIRDKDKERINRL